MVEVGVGRGQGLGFGWVHRFRVTLSMLWVASRCFKDSDRFRGVGSKGRGQARPRFTAHVCVTAASSIDNRG